MAEVVPLVRVCTKEMIKDGVGTHWEHSSIQVTKKPDYVLSNSGNREANFSGDVKFTGKKYDISGYYSYYNTTIGRASHTGNVNDLYNSITNKFLRLSMILRTTLEIQSKKYSIIWLK
jgi:hypothetical protein